MRREKTVSPEAPSDEVRQDLILCALHSILKVKGKDEKLYLLVPGKIMDPGWWVVVEHQPLELQQVEQ